jgi:hypothetical protein
MRKICSDNRDHLSSGLLVAWLAVVAWGVWMHVASSEEPLIGDARTYWLKAENFWHSVGEKRVFNPFDLYPTIRPPGTVLMSYPFGFGESTRGFLFRSIYLPIILTAGAIYLAARSIPSTSARVDGVCLALFMCSLPLFYHFEYHLASPTYWGLVDAFFAGTAALAVSFALLGGACASPLATVAAALLTGVSFSIKPAGLFVIPLTAASFGLAVGVNLATVAAGATRKKFSQSFWLGIAAFVLINGSLIYVGMHSGYFSSENVALGNQALTWFRGEAWALPSLSGLAWNVHASLSFVFVGALVLTISAGLFTFRRLRGIATNRSSATAFAGWISAILYLGVGVWFWMVYTGGSQIRYFYPFVLSAAVCLVPLSLLILDGTNAIVKTLARCVLILPSLNIAVLLALGNPPLGWQELSGVNISIHPKPDLALARRLLNEIRERKESAVVYEEPGTAAKIESHWGAYPTPAVIESYWGFELTAHPELPNISVTAPYDFLHPSAHRLKEIANADFLLFPMVRNPSERARRLNIREVLDYPTEQDVFQAWLSTLSTEDGVELFDENNDFRILRVIDSDKLTAALEVFRSGRTWGKVFTEANPRSRLWLSEDEIMARVNGGDAVRTDAVFGQIFSVKAVAVRRNNMELQVEAWWTPIGEKMPPGAWFFWVHLIGKAGAIVGTEAKLPHFARAPSPDQFRTSLASMQFMPDGLPKSIAFGFYRLQMGRPEALEANQGGRFVIMPLQ